MSRESLLRANQAKHQRAMERNRQLEPFLREHSQKGTGWLGEQLGLNHKHVRKIMIQLGIPRRPKTGPAPGQMQLRRGGRLVDKRGYVYIYTPDHPFVKRYGYVQEHRLVVEKRIGRYLLRTEVVHHIDGNPSNNSNDNLELISSNGEHIRRTVWLGRKHKPETIEKMRRSALRRWQAQKHAATLAESTPDDLA